MGKTYQEALKKAERDARLAKKEASAVKNLMLHFSRLEPTDLYLKFNEEMNPEALKDFEEAVKKYTLDNIPVQYLIGYVYFYGYKFSVDNHVLIPRFETEELVANILMQYDDQFTGKSIKLVDIGTGSGCLAIALKLEEPSFDVTATDISVEALEVAKKNAKNLKADITFIAGDMLEPLKGLKFDALISNPPYIPSEETVDEIIHQNEPHEALYGGSDGLRFYEIILSKAKEILERKSFIAFEHGFDKAEEIRALAKKYFPDSVVYTLKDMQGKDRMTFVVNNEISE
ncbi:MAG: peptide chain release factor N(5)-glutamine methyltransferase [Firmicutes bacterium]|nr:peptide chain release factor N(5)-glutamine methyltransferase [Bacillota bacterium]